MRPSRQPAKPKPTASQDTRERLLEAAGHVFAEKGFDRATAKEICKRAGTNTAAVNYYFGGVDLLYTAVLEDARNRFISLDRISAAMVGRTDPRAKLRALIGLIVQTLTGPLSQSWMVRVFAQEWIAPTSLLDRLNKKVTAQRLAILREIVSEVMELPPDHPAVAHGSLYVMTSCMLLMIADRSYLRQVFPSVGFGSDDTEDQARYMFQYTLGGLSAIGRDVRKQPRRRRRNCR